MIVGHKSKKSSLIINCKKHKVTIMDPSVDSPLELDVRVIETNIVTGLIHVRGLESESYMLETTIHIESFVLALFYYMYSKPMNSHQLFS
jgi:hypothetical protein